MAKKYNGVSFDPRHFSRTQIPFFAIIITIAIIMGLPIMIAIGIIIAKKGICVLEKCLGSNETPLYFFAILLTS